MMGSLHRAVSDRTATGLHSLVALAIPLAGIVISEWSVYVGRLGIALTGHLLTLIVCAIAPLWLRDELPIFQAFVLLPVFRLVNLGMPIFVPLTLFWFPLVYGPFIPASVLVARGNEIVTLRAGTKHAALALPAVLLGSIVLAELEYRILQPSALIPEPGLTQFALLVVVMVLFVALVEELLFRGILQQSLQGAFGTWSGIVLAAGVFALMHAGYGHPSEIGFTFGTGLLYGIIYEWSDSIATVTVFHGALNVFLFGAIPLYGPLLPFG